MPEPCRLDSSFDLEHIPLAACPYRISCVSARLLSMAFKDPSDGKKGWAFSEFTITGIGSLSSLFMKLFVIVTFVENQVVSTFG